MKMNAPAPGTKAVNAVLLALALVATVMNWTWFWGLACMAVGLDGIRTETVLIATPMRRADAPVMWATASLGWILVGLWFIALPWIPRAWQG